MGPGARRCPSTTRCTATPSTGTWCEAAAEAAAFTRDVARPDLLVLGAFLHDIGKGLPGDHSVVGAPLAVAIAARLGLARPTWTRSSGWSGCTCCCPTWPPGATSTIR